ncbi:MAG: hypothetical protein HOO96_09160, partial [Polyangiaceae bacterium]|nr:hypothetical protein [Polyangiaceae bacterium]
MMTDDSKQRAAWLPSFLRRPSVWIALALALIVGVVVLVRARGPKVRVTTV